MGFCVIPALVGIVIIFFSILAAFSDNAGVYEDFSLVFLMVFLGLVLVSHSAISVINLCKCEQ